MVTVVDVAKKAGVSVATVSRVLNSNYMVTKEKREKVLKAIQELGYVPKTTIRNEQNNEKKVIVVVAAVIIHEVIAGIQDLGEQLGYEVIISYHASQTQHLHSWSFLPKEQLGGVIILTMFFNTQELIELSETVPLVQCTQYTSIPNTYAVTVDDEVAAYRAVNHLVETGKKNIAFIGLGVEDGDGNFSLNFSRDRYIGYRRALEENQVTYNSNLVKHGDYSYETGVHLANELLKSGAPIDGVFCVTDNLAVACINTFQEAGYRIPEDIGICGFDNQEISEMTNPKLTTIDQPFYEIGYESMRMLESMIKGEISTGRRILIDHKLIKRGSTVNEK
ncbi:LacI family DNA-binding transcriptional regulator [Metabacillus endolithicus]|uniref:LacI family DNA-binding transcriptional regulator n=1 Tax=Metabacillus endolithicus TaxID=1535204 RepID=A0ABW5C3L3_9BACI|nr:LacI family DNA-binding transcriptional regulator [Metabacillus endolithicus]UPG62618.1 LacI family transcriptional regulator [Metabacillus endolithicus]